MTATVAMPPMVIPLPEFNRRLESPLDSTELLRFVGLIGAAVLVIPGVIWGLRDRRTALRNIAIWVALIGAGVLLFWLQVRPK